MAGTALGISGGGTSQTTAAGARIALGLEPGVNIQPWDADLDAISALAGTGIAVRTAADTWAVRTLTAPAAGFTITNPAGIAGNPTFVLSDDLGAIEALNTNGILTRTASNTWAARTLIAPAAGITVTNGDGVSGNPTLVLADDLGALEALSGTNTIYYRSAASTWTAVTFNSESLNFTSGEIAVDFGANGIIAQTAAETFSSRTITGTANKITVTNGDGVSGNPTLTIPDAVTLVSPTISTSLILPQGSAPAPTAEGDLRWDTDDNAMVVGDASAQKIFRANNWEFIGVASPSSASEVTFTDLSAYRFLKLSGRLRPATDGVSLAIRTSTNNGSSYDSGVSDYNQAYVYQSGATAGGTDGANSAQWAPAVTAIGNVAPEGIWFDISLFEFNQSLQCFYICHMGQLNASTASFTGLTIGRRLSTTARDAIRFAFSSGNVADGHISVWGTRGSA